MGEPRRNVELKARDPDPERTLAVCHELGAEDHGELWQRDTYYAVARGRLKLREQRPGEAHLIAYERPDGAQQRESRYRIAPVADPEQMVAVLAAALPVGTVVTKRRRLWLHGPVRIHLDDVEGLGRFLEFEAVAPAGSDLSTERELVARLRERFGVSDERLVATGYADQLEAAGVRRA